MGVNSPSLAPAVVSLGALPGPSLVVDHGWTLSHTWLSL